MAAGQLSQVGKPCFQTQAGTIRGTAGKHIHVCPRACNLPFPAPTKVSMALRKVVTEIRGHQLPRGRSPCWQAQQGQVRLLSVSLCPWVLAVLGYPALPSSLWLAGFGTTALMWLSQLLSTPPHLHLLSQRNSGYDWVRLQGFQSQMASFYSQGIPVCQGRKTVGRGGGRWPPRQPPPSLGKGISKYLNKGQGVGRP